MPALYGNMQIGFPFTCLIKDQQWVPRESTFIRDPHSVSNPEMWNLSCIRCHVTAGVSGHDRNTDEMLSTATDLGVLCEAWHLGWEPSKDVTGDYWQPRFMAELLDVPYSAVRYVAYKALKSYPGHESFAYDHVAHDSLLQEAQSRAIGIWEQQGNAFPEAQSRQLLLHDSGRVYSEQLQALLDKGDDTPIRLRK